MLDEIYDKVVTPSMWEDNLIARYVQSQPVTEKLSRQYQETIMTQLEVMALKNRVDPEMPILFYGEAGDHSGT